MRGDEPSQDDYSILLIGPSRVPTEGQSLIVAPEWRLAPAQGPLGVPHPPERGAATPVVRQPSTDAPAQIPDPFATPS